MEVTGHRRHWKQLCRGIEIPCRLVFSCSSKVKINHLKELLEIRQYTLQDIHGSFPHLMKKSMNNSNMPSVSEGMLNLKRFYEYQLCF